MVMSLALLLSLLFPPLFLILLAFNYWKPSPDLRTTNLPPSPPRLPFIGNLHQVGPLPHRDLHALSRRHGAVMLLKLGCVPTVVVSSADAAQEILKTHDLIFSSRPPSELARRILYGFKDVIFAPQGEYWRQVRKICVLHLLSAKKVQSFRGVTEEEVSLLVKRVARSSDDDKTVNLSQFLNSFTNSLISRVALGKKYAAYGEDGGSNRFCTLVNEISVLFGGFYVREYFPYLGWWSKLSGMDARVERCSRNWDAFLDAVIRDHEGGSHAEHSGDDLVDILLAYQKDHQEGFNLDKDGIKGILLDIFAAGTDTSYITMEWTMAELVRNPSKLKRVQDEIRQMAGRKTIIEEDDINRMIYLKAVIKEALRLHPPAPILVPRESTEDARIQGYYIPSKTRVLVNYWSLGRDPEYWEVPQEFRPERFLASLLDFRGHDLHFIPFGAGRRICPGMQFAVSSVELVLANLLYHFDWKMPDGKCPEELDMADASGFTTRMKSNLVLLATHHP